MPDQLTRRRVRSCASTRMRQPVGPLHVFLRHHAARTQVSALSGVRLPECFARVRAVDLRDAQRQSARLRAEAGSQGCTVFVDIEVLVDHDARTAMRAVEQLRRKLVGRRPGTALRRHAARIGRIHRRPSHTWHRRRGDAASAARG